MAVLERGGHRDDEYIRFLGREARGEVAGLHGGFDKNVEIGLDNVDFALVDGVDHLGRNIDANDVESFRA